MNRADKEQLEITTYVIEKTFAKHGTYRISKRVLDVEMDFYLVTIKHGHTWETGAQKDVWCSCQGFHRQKFPQIEHKHIRMAIHYQAIGEPKQAEYRFSGSGHATIITHGSKVI